MYYTYILQSLKDSNYYIGQTSFLHKRIKQHNDGKVRSTKCRRPLVVVYFEKYNTRSGAIRRETQIKKMKGGSSFKRLLQKE